MTYQRFKEYNDNEGESWNFYIPIEGNENALYDLKKQTDRYEEEFQDGTYTLYGDPLTEQEVDTLVKYGDSGYMDFHNKLEGKLVLGEKDVIRFKDGELEEDRLYKGGIRDFME